MSIRHISCALLGVALICAMTRPAFADAVDVRSVTQVFTTIQGGPELHLRTFSLHGSPIEDSRKLTQQEKREQSPPLAELADVSGNLLAGIEFASLTQQQTTQKAPQSDVEAAICDCGELNELIGGFPKWPFLFLAGIPLFFIDTGDTPPPPLTPVPTPTLPTIVETPTPEPTSVLLLLSGLGAIGWRVRRRLNRK